MPSTRSAVLDEAPRGASGPILSTDGLTVRFGGITALDEVSLQIRPGEIVGLLGPNGAGKTTLFNAISGFVPLDEGRIVLDGREIQRLFPYERVAAGLGRTFQHVRLFRSLSVQDNLLIAQHRHLHTSAIAAMLRLPSWRRDEARAREMVERMLELIDLRPWRDRRPIELSYGTTRFLELATVLSLQPKILLLDEPATGIQQKEVEALGPMLRRVRDETGCAIVLIEHDMGLLFGVAERVYALDFGKVIAEGTPTEVAEDPLVLESYLGRTRRESGASA
jgi:ABC-type branched-subunit amino acid transport system ATPase component